jgi:hypothetical protein
MTSTVTEATMALLSSSSYDLLSTTVGVAVVIALGILLVERELIRILARERSVVSGWAFEIALIPLLLAFFVTIATRLAELVL